jgi:putative endonuclease
MGLVQSIAAVFSRFARPSSASADLPAHALGRRGERIAARHLRRARYKILYRNFRARGGGEADLVCRDRAANELVFVEVKTRRTRDFGDPAHAVDAAKQHLLARAAFAWLRLLDHPDIRFRFDIVEVVVTDAGTSVNIIRNAFELPRPYLY